MPSTSSWAEGMYVVGSTGLDSGHHDMTVDSSARTSGFFSTGLFTDEETTFLGLFLEDSVYVL